MRRLASSILGVALVALTAASPALAASRIVIHPGGGPHFGGGGAHFGGGGFRGGQRFGHGYRGGPRFGGGGYRHRGFGGGAAIGAGIAGLATGAIVGGALANGGYGGYGYGGDGYGYGYAPAPYAVAEQPAYAAPVASPGDAEAYCVRRFKSYDPASGTYLGYDGLRHPCP